MSVLLFALVLMTVPPTAVSQNAPRVNRHRVAGYVKVQGTTDPVSEAFVTLRPIQVSANATVAPLGLETRTDDHGYFSFAEVPPGTYGIIVERQGFWAQTLAANFASRISITTLTVTEREAPPPLDIFLTIAPKTLLTGRVFDANGRPVPDIQISVYRRSYGVYGTTVMGTDPVLKDASRTTDDRGEYRLFGVPESTYFVGASPASSVSSIYARTYYPGTLDASRAVPVHLVAGTEVRADILMQALPKTRISGKVVDPVAVSMGLPPAPKSLHAVPRGRSPLSELSPRSFPNLLDEERRTAGEFEIEGVLPGHYDLMVVGGAPSLQRWPIGRTAIDVGTDDLEDVLVTVEPGVTVAIKVITNGDLSTLPAASIHPQLRPKENWFIPFELAMLRPGEDPGPRRRPGDPIRPPRPLTDAIGAFVFSSVARGSYYVDLIGLPEDAYVAEIRQGGTIVENQILDVVASPLDIEVRVYPGGSVIEGQVSSASTKLPVSKGTVVLAPTGARRADPSLTKRVVTDSSGRFVIKGVGPGEYILFASENLPANAHINLDFIEEIEPHAAMIRVTEPNQRLHSSLIAIETR